MLPLPLALAFLRRAQTAPGLFLSLSFFYFFYGFSIDGDASFRPLFWPDLSEIEREEASLINLNNNGIIWCGLVASPQQPLVALAPNLHMSSRKMPLHSYALSVDILRWVINTGDAINLAYFAYINMKYIFSYDLLFAIYSFIRVCAVNIPASFPHQIYVYV